MIKQKYIRFDENRNHVEFLYGCYNECLRPIIEGEFDTDRRCQAICTRDKDVVAGVVVGNPYYNIFI